MDKILEIILSPDSEKFRGDLFERYEISDDDIFIINSNFKKFFSGEIKFLDFLKECSDLNIKLIEEYLDFHLKLIEEYLDSDYNTLMKDFSNFIISKNNINGSDQPLLNKNDDVLNKTGEKNKKNKNDKKGSGQRSLTNKENIGSDQRSLVNTNSYKHGDIKNILEDDKNKRSDQPLLNKNDDVLNKTGEKNKNDKKGSGQRSLTNKDDKTEKYAEEIRKIIKEEINQDFLLGAKNKNKELTDGVFNPFDNPSLIVDEVINIIGLRFKNEKNRDKFYSILIKYLKNIRNKHQSYEILVDDKIGLSVSKIAAEKILNLTEKIKKQKENNLLEYKKSKLIKKEKKDSVNNILNVKSDNSIENKKSSGQSQLVNKKNKDLTGLKTEEDIFHFYDGNIEELYMKREKERSKEIDMDMDIGGDIHRDFLSNRLVGPVEELAYFTIIDFRNLGEDLDERIKKLKQKINVLEDYGLNKKILGIKAWLNSEVSEVYKAILNESIEFGSIENAVLKRKEKGRLYLTEEEINKIAELNREFRI
ncbi:hypothetical protein K9M42_01260 [Patescibacteria group bacterium]|nr:hypothetical protein [Patescibacteria group bacterium]